MSGVRQAFDGGNVIRYGTIEVGVVPPLAEFLHSVNECGAVESGEFEDFAFSIGQLRENEMGFALCVGEIAEFSADEFRQRFELAGLFVRDLARALIVGEDKFIKDLAGGFPFACGRVAAACGVWLPVNGYFGVAFLEAFRETRRAYERSFSLSFSCANLPVVFPLCQAFS